MEFLKILGSIIAGGGLQYIVGGRQKVASVRTRLAKQRIKDTDDIADQFVSTVNDLTKELSDSARLRIDLERRLNDLIQENEILKQKLKQ